MQTSRPNSISGWAAMIAVFLLVACAAHPPVVPPKMAPGAERPGADTTAAESRPDYSENSLWQSGGGLDGLFQDTKARRVGDIVTVKIEESSKATNKANTKTGRDSSLSAGLEGFLGIEDWWKDTLMRRLPTHAPKVNPFGSATIKGGMSSDFEGDGSTTRSGDLTAFITCRVTEVMPNGNLRIVGTREVLVNHENQVIILSGLIRPRDITGENVIRSTFISEAKIAYSGSGIIDDRQRPGWMANFLNTVWPF